MAVKQRQGLVKRNHPELSVSRQCRLLSLNRSSLYYQPVRKEASMDQPFKQEIELIMTEFPYYGSRKVAAHIKKSGILIGRRRTIRLLREMNLKAVQPKKRRCGKRIEHPVRPYLLKNLVVTAPNQVWGTDITYIQTLHGRSYLIALIDWFSRMILGWKLTHSLDARPCVQLLKETIERYGAPQIMNHDQGVQFTSQDWINTADSNGILVSMSGKGRCYDNIRTERTWRSLKQEEVYLKDYLNHADARVNIEQYIRQYNYQRLHQALGYRTPASIYHSGGLWTPRNQGNQENQGLVLCV